MATRARLVPDLTPAQAAATLGLRSEAELWGALDVYRARGLQVPRPDPVTGRFDPEAWERFRRLRNPHLFPELAVAPQAQDATLVAASRVIQWPVRGGA